MEQSTSELIERMARLEHQQAELRRANRRLRLVTGTLILLTGAAVLMGQPAPTRALRPSSLCCAAATAK
jgi:hypothetical protein